NFSVLHDPIFKLVYASILPFSRLICILLCWTLAALALKRIPEKKRQFIKVLELDSLAGPPRFPIRFIGNAFQIPAPKYIMETCLNWCKKYEHCFRFTAFGMECVVISDPLLAQSLLSSYDIGHANRASTYKFLEGFEGLAFSNGRKWQTLKKLIAPAFHFKSVEFKIRTFNTHSNKFVQNLGRLADQDGMIRTKSITKLLGSYAVQSVIDSVITLPGSCNDDDTDRFVKSFKRYTEILSHRILNPWLTIRFFWKFHPLSTEFDEAIKGMNSFAHILIQNHMAKKSTQANELHEKEDHCLVSQMLENNASFEEIQTEVTTMLFAHESNTLSLLYFLLMLALHPEHQEKCREEVDQIVNDGALNFNDLSGLKYMERCFLETLRLLPPVFMFGRQLGSPLCLKNNITLPTGTNVYVCPLAMHKDEKYFPNPESFNPDRFLPEECKQRHQYAYLPFSAGPRVCPGES
ncbi:putative cytochrome P450 4aa1, partial [Orchesella cincta]